MKKTILLWLLTAVLLWGCAAEDLPDTTDTPASSTSIQAVPEGYYAPGHPLEQQTGGALRVYPLNIPNCQGIAAMGTDILVFSGDSGSTQLTLLRGDERYPAVMLSVDTEAYATQATAEGLSFYDAARRETVILDENLREITTIAVPEDLTGIPLLTADRKSMYYCAGSNLCVLDLDSGISRVLRQHTNSLTLETIQMDGTLVQCREADGGCLFFSAETGQLVEETETDLILKSGNGHYLAALGVDSVPALVFGTGTAPVQTLQTNAQAEYTLLPGSFAVLEATSDGLNYYDLSSGLRTSHLSLDSSLIAAADGGNGILWLLADDSTLYRWDTKALPSGDATVYTAAYFTRSQPDLEGIARCQELARQIGERHGVEILVWEDALDVAPWDYRVTEEYQVPVLEAQLQLLDRYLGNFPEGFFAQLSENSAGLTICLVRQLEGYSGQETVEEASGVQYWVEDHAYIALSTTSATEGGLYHELCHVFDTRVFAQSSAYDQWEELNPGGFKYDYDYAANATRNAGEYLRDAERCFIDTYSMSFPKEDRARVLEYAMTPGNEHYFQSEVMQAKLKQICLGLREAFGLKKSPDTFLWEQYLKQSLAYTK